MNKFKDVQYDKILPITANLRFNENKQININNVIIREFL